MSCYVIIWNRAKSFCLWETQVTILAVSSKQSRKKGSFHSISEAVTSPMTLTCILIDSTEDPTFFNKLSIPWVGHTKHCTQGHSFWISTKTPLHVPSKVSFLQLLYHRPLARAVPVWCPSPEGKTASVPNTSLVCLFASSLHDFIFFLVSKNKFAAGGSD